MAVSLELVGLPLYEREMSLRTSDLAQRCTREAQVYRRAKLLQRYFHVCWTPVDGQSIIGLCDEWLVREYWEPVYVAEMANDLQWMEQQELLELEGPATVSDVSKLPPLVLAEVIEASGQGG